MDSQDFRDEADMTAGLATTVQISKEKAMESQQYPQISDLTDDELVTLRARIDAELGERGISFNVGVLGEKLSIEFFNSASGLPNLLKAPAGAKNVDALSREGDRYSIKAFLKAKKTSTIYPDDKDPNKQLFEYLLVVRLDNSYQLDAIYRYSWSEFVEKRAWDKRMNAWYLPLSQKNLKSGEVIFGK